jgi:GTP cyclohydrolase IA
VSDANRCADTLPAVAGLAGDALEIEEAEEERWAAVRQRHITAEQWELFEGYMREIFTALGLPATTPSTVDTPRRFPRALFDASRGYEGDESWSRVSDRMPWSAGLPDQSGRRRAHPVLFAVRASQPAVLRPRVRGLHSARAYSWAVQAHPAGAAVRAPLLGAERIGQQLTESLDSGLAPHGVAVYLEAVHLCTQMRGVRERQSSTRTTYWRGTYDTDAQLRAEFLEMCSQQG